MKESDTHVSITVPFEPYNNPEIATMTAIDYLMNDQLIDIEQARVAQWVYEKYYKVG